MHHVRTFLRAKHAYVLVQTYVVEQNHDVGVQKPDRVVRLLFLDIFFVGYE